MKPTIKADVENICDALEHLKASLPRLLLCEEVEVAARLGAASKTIETICTAIKDEIKTSLRHKSGEVAGEHFKAILNVVPTQQFDQKRFKEADFETYTRFCKVNNVERVTFEPR